MLNIIKYSLEGVADGNAIIEKELVYHAILEDMSVLNNAAKIEKQEQWEIKIPKTENNLYGGRLRVRKTYIPNVRSKAQYIFCSKTKNENGNLEVELVSTKDQFDQFVAMADSGMIKTRYYFPIPDTNRLGGENEWDNALVWEIDVFENNQGEIVPWVKIDIELNPNTKKEFLVFPFATKQIITSQYGKRTEEEEAIVSKLYDDDYCIRH